MSGITGRDAQGEEFSELKLDATPANLRGLAQLYWVRVPKGFNGAASKEAEQEADGALEQTLKDASFGDLGKKLGKKKDSLARKLKNRARKAAGMEVAEDGSGEEVVPDAPPACSELAKYFTPLHVGPGRTTPDSAVRLLIPSGKAYEHEWFGGNLEDKAGGSASGGAGTRPVLGIPDGHRDKVLNDGVDRLAGEPSWTKSPCLELFLAKGLRDTGTKRDWDADFCPPQTGKDGQALNGADGKAAKQDPKSCVAKTGDNPFCDSNTPFSCNDYRYLDPRIISSMFTVEDAIASADKSSGDSAVKSIFYEQIRALNAKVVHKMGSLGTVEQGVASIKFSNTTQNSEVPVTIPVACTDHVDGSNLAGGADAFNPAMGGSVFKGLLSEQNNNKEAVETWVKDYLGGSGDESMLKVGGQKAQQGIQVWKSIQETNLAPANGRTKDEDTCSLYYTSILNDAYLEFTDQPDGFDKANRGAVTKQTQNAFMMPELQGPQDDDAVVEEGATDDMGKGIDETTEQSQATTSAFAE